MRDMWRSDISGNCHDNSRPRRGNETRNHACGEAPSQRSILSDSRISPYVEATAINIRFRPGAVVVIGCERNVAQTHAAARKINNAVSRKFLFMFNTLSVSPAANIQHARYLQGSNLMAVRRQRNL